jgi:hypothetical protein
MTITSKATPPSFIWLASLSPSDTYETASTNGFILYPSSPISTVSLDSGVTVPYTAIFYITFNAQRDTNNTAVTVRTMEAEVVDGHETSVHGGQADHFRQTFPVQREEENIFEAISSYLNLPYQ